MHYTFHQTHSKTDHYACLFKSEKHLQIESKLQFTPCVAVPFDKACLFSQTPCMKKILIVIPARYASSRLPGKPLVEIAGIPMIKIVASIAKNVCEQATTSDQSCRYVVATDHDAIMDYCLAENINAVMTSEDCRNGTERCWDAVSKTSEKPDLIINLQGDNPTCPPWIILDLIESWNQCQAHVYTPSVLLNWEEYEKLKKAKEVTPYSGTTVLVNKDNYALAFSKSIIPSIREEEKARALPQFTKFSPIRRHVGLYAYTYESLENYFHLENSPYELNCVEGLEQLRFLHNGYKVKIVDVDYRGRETTSGVDSPEDIDRVEKIFNKYGFPC